MVKVRLDALLHERGLFPSRSRAAASVMAGEVRIGAHGGRAAKPGMLVTADVELAVDERPRYVSRGGIKLSNALVATGVDAAGRDCLDVGASTGGFTDCLLQSGASRVIALDVAYGELDWSLRTDDRVDVIERRNARSLEPADLPYIPDLIVADVSFISLAKVVPAVLGCAADRFDALLMVKPQFEVGRDRVGSGGVVRDPAHRRAAIEAVAASAQAAGADVIGFASSLLPGPKGNRETFAHVAERGRPGALHGAAIEAAVLEVDPVKHVTVLTHGRPRQVAAALDALRAAADEAGVDLRLDPAEIGEHGRGVAEIVDLSDPRHDDISLCIALGGDGTILRALRRYAGTTVPVFAVNFGEIGFLATIEPDEMANWFPRALRDEFEIVKLPALGFTAHADRFVAINDLAVMRKPGQRVASLAYVIGGEEVGSVRSDGVVAATPVGSTGYNLANGGPVLAWGVEGFAVSFVAPHSLTARALVVAPGDALEIQNRARGDADIFVDGRPAGSLGAGDSLTVRFIRDVACLAQTPGSSFYHRLRERFGRLAY